MSWVRGGMDSRRRRFSGVIALNCAFTSGTPRVSSSYDLRPVQGSANEKSPLRRIFEGRLFLRICQQTSAQSEAREGGHESELHTFLSRRSGDRVWG
jgi:hypothetical protein